MRIKRLGLSRYGVFTDVVLEMPAGDLDFHLVYGANEAGKSTMRNAIADLLYGIDKRSPYKFLHGYGEMCIGAKVEVAGKIAEFQRLKREKGSLVDFAGNAMPDTSLVPFVGNTDKTFFLRMFALDHETMVRGGRDILNSSSELGQILFQAAAGLNSIHAVRDALDAQSDELWGPRSKDSRAYSRAEKRFNEARSRLKDVQVTAQTWSAAKRAFDNASEEERLAKDSCSKVSVEREMLERVKRVAPYLANRDEAQSLLLAMGSTVLLPEDATQTLVTATTHIHSARSEASVHETSIETNRASLAGLVVNDTLLSEGDEITRLSGLIASVRNALRDIPKREAEVALQDLRVHQEAAKVGWSDLSTGVIIARLPAKALRAEVEALAKRCDTVDASGKQKSSEVREQRLALDDMDARLQRLPEPVERPALAAALKQASSLDLDERLDEIAGEVGDAKRKLARAVGALAPWKGAMEVLEGLHLPDDAEIRALIDARKRASAECERLEAEKQRLQLDIKTTGADLTRLEKRHHPATEEQLAAARASRDSAWRRIRSGELAAEAAGDGFEIEMSEADALADRRYSEAENTAKAETYADQLEKLQAVISEIGEQCKEWTNRLEVADQSWMARMGALELPGVSLDQLQTWTKQRSLVLEAVDTLDKAQGRKTSLEDRAGRYASTLRDELIGAGTTPGLDDDLGDLMTKAKAILDADLVNGKRREELEGQLRTARVKLRKAEVEDRDAQATLGVWLKSWDARLAACGLRPDMGLDGAEVAIEAFREIDDAAGRMRDTERERIEPMQRDIEEFGLSVADVVNRCAADLVGRPMADAAEELWARLQEARAGSAERTRLQKAIAEEEELLAAVRRKETAAQQTISPLMEMAGVGTLDDLQSAIGKSDRYRGIDKEAKDHANAAVTGGGGLTLAELEREVQQVNLAELDTRLTSVIRSQETAQKHWTESIQCRALGEAAYSRIGGTDEAAIAESERQGALAEMANAVEEYVRVRTGARLLTWALERYREEKQAPLLRTAGEYFALLTNGQHLKLMIEYAEAPRLVSKKADGTSVGIEGMSDGTSDQLFLALRLAALDMHLQGGTPLPFIADDLLINCDDDRAMSGFAAFVCLAGKTQVLYFTHHQHLIDLARRASDDRVHVIRL